METLTALTTIALTISAASFLATLSYAIRSRRKSRSDADAAWVAFEAAHPELIPGAIHPPFPTQPPE